MVVIATIDSTLRIGLQQSLTDKGDLFLFLKEGETL